jgi:hypothetical protein
MEIRRAVDRTTLSWPPVDDDEYPDDENAWVYWEERAAQRSFCDLRGFDPEDLGAVIAIERQWLDAYLAQKIDDGLEDSLYDRQPERLTVESQPWTQESPLLSWHCPLWVASAS